MHDVVYRPRAVRQIEAISDYTMAEWGQAQAKRYLTDLRRQIDFAAEYPGIGSDVTGLPPQYRKVRVGVHRIIYRYTEHVLTVVAIVHEREDISEDIEGS